jgi:DNA-binding CsgD family transcriptional regulator
MRSHDADLLALLYEGMFETPLWHGFLERLRLRTDALSTTLTFRPVDEEAPVELYAGERTPPHIRQLFLEKYVRDPLPYRQMREGRVYALDELIDASDPVQRSFRDEMVLSWGMGNLRSVRVAEASGVSAWLNCGGDRIVGSTVSALLTSLVPHVRIALRSFIALERERFRSAMASDAIGRLNFGWLTLDSRCRIVDMTPNIAKLFERTSVLRRGRYDRLTPASPAVDRELQALIKRFASDGDSRPKAINLSRDPWMDMLVAPVQDRSISAASPPVAIAYLSGDRSSQADRCEQLIDLFGLLPSEARLAWAIAQGMSIAEAAMALGITLETARNYSKKIYAKTGSRSQAALVRNILTGVLALA